ncbi:MAG: nitrogenase component 1 [Peptococcaceae bacterium]|nr:nitrogenase component 1 [Peptococcaceae bacterium]
MRDFHLILPTFAPDFSGVCSTLFELGGTVVIHDAGGCTGTFTGYDEPRWFDQQACVFTSNLDDVEAVFGTDEILLNKIFSSYDYLNSNFIALLGSPSPMVLGTDYKALARIIEKKTGKKTLAFDTKGTEFYDRGVRMALLALAQNFLPAKRDPAQIIPRSVNLLGATPLDVTNRHNVEVVRGLLEGKGFQVLSVWAMGSGLEEIGASLRAQCNIALTTPALETARYLEERYGMPWLPGAFSGQAGAGEFLLQLQALLEGRSFLPYSPPSPKGRKTLVIGDQLIANGIRQSLELDLGLGGVDVLTFFSGDDAFQRPGDASAIDEELLLKRIRSGSYDLVIGDGMYRLFDKPAPCCRYVEIPHVAVSSRLGWSNPACPFGSPFLDLLSSGSEVLCG